MTRIFRDPTVAIVHGLHFYFRLYVMLKKNAFLAQKNPTVISESSRIFPGLTAADLIDHSFLMGSRR